MGISAKWHRQQLYKKALDNLWIFLYTIIVISVKCSCFVAIGQTTDGKIKGGIEMRKKVKQLVLTGMVLLAALPLAVSAETASDADISTGAARGEDAVSVDLIDTQDCVFSGSVNGMQVEVSGRNYVNSAKNVKFITQYKTGWFSWADDNTVEVAPGKSCSATKSFKYSSDHTWRLQLNPTGTNQRDCQATGTIKRVKSQD